MNKGKIIFYDDDSAIISQFEELMKESGFEIITYADLAELRKNIQERNSLENVKALIFDLAQNKQEGGLKKDFEILKDIEDKFNNYRIPIFIHSAFANDIDNFNNNGTVWKIEKSGTSIADIVETITKLDESGFIEAFTPGGIIEQTLFSELHKSFTEQFRKGEIEKIIDAIKKSKPEHYKERAIIVFKRIAIKALMTDLLAPVIDKGETVNPIEHYYRRTNTNAVSFWTGDIWKKNKEDEFCIILSPRCDIVQDKLENIIVCKIDKITDEYNVKKNRIQSLEKFLRDNIEGKAIRHLPVSPIFKGGKVNLSKHETVPKATFKDSFTYVVTLSDDLTNEILGKFAYYFLRTGINTISVSEFDSYLDLLKEIPEDEKQLDKE